MFSLERQILNEILVQRQGDIREVGPVSHQLDPHRGVFKASIRIRAVVDPQLA